MLLMIPLYVLQIEVRNVGLLLVAIAIGFDFGNIHRVRYAVANTPYNATMLLNC
jgi:hypothetical protein